MPLTTFVIRDPDDGRFENLTDPLYNNRFNGLDLYAGPEHRFIDRTGMVFQFFSPVEAIITDPLGRRQGLDPRTNIAYEEIPNSSRDRLLRRGPIKDSELDPPLHLYIRTPVEGEYTVTVIGLRTGVYSGQFDAIDINLDSSSIELPDNIPTAAGVVHTYKVHFSKAAGLVNIGF